MNWYLINAGGHGGEYQKRVNGILVTNRYRLDTRNVEIDLLGTSTRSVRLFYRVYNGNLKGTRLEVFYQPDNKVQVKVGHTNDKIARQARKNVHDLVS